MVIKISTGVSNVAHGDKRHGGKHDGFVTFTDYIYTSRYSVFHDIESKQIVVTSCTHVVTREVNAQSNTKTRTHTLHWPPSASDTEFEVLWTTLGL